MDVIVRDSLGGKGDAASATGSAHAKIKDVKAYLSGALNTLVSSRQKNIEGYTQAGYFHDNATSSYVTIVNTTGSGFCSFTFNAGDYTGYIWLVLDGITIWAENAVSFQNMFPTFVVPFNESITLKTKRAGSNGSVNSRAVVYKDV
jgi:hypothetical protein